MTTLLSANVGCRRSDEDSVSTVLVFIVGKENGDLDILSQPNAAPRRTRGDRGAAPRHANPVGTYDWTLQ